MRHAVFQDHGTLSSAELFFPYNYGHGCHLGHVTKAIFTKVRLPLPMKAPHKTLP